MCNLCKVRQATIDYELIDKSYIRICEVCGNIIYNKDLSPKNPDRLFHIIKLREYVLEIINLTSEIGKREFAAKIATMIIYDKIPVNKLLLINFLISDIKFNKEELK